MSRVMDLDFICFMTVPHGLCALFPGVRSSRQSTNTLAHLQPLLVARHVSGSQPLCPRLYHAISKLPRHLPEGKLQLRSIPLKPWSHIGVDFITSSESFTCILVVVDRISKACRLIPLTGLPSAIVTVETLFPYMFRNYSLPADIVLIWTSVHLQSK